MDTQPVQEYPRPMTSRIAALHPERYLKAMGVIGAVTVLLFVLIAASSAKSTSGAALWVIQIAMFSCLTGALAWPPKTFRTASVWALWLAMIASFPIHYFHS